MESGIGDSVRRYDIHNWKPIHVSVLLEERRTRTYLYHRALLDQYKIVDMTNHRNLSMPEPFWEIGYPLSDDSSKREKDICVYNYTCKLFLYFVHTSCRPSSLSGLQRFEFWCGRQVRRASLRQANVTGGPGCETSRSVGVGLTIYKVRLYVTDDFDESGVARTSRNCDRRERQAQGSPHEKQSVQFARVEDHQIELLLGIYKPIYHTSLAFTDD
ncbi:hypothetical protein HD554DRAFT_2054079 [Boletus coccyginus]|nr:hypothetical protein HD554DRAFT_2054079 [Boletus coccyginus]